MDPEGGTRDGVMTKLYGDSRVTNVDVPRRVRIRRTPIEVTKKRGEIF